MLDSTRHSTREVTPRDLALLHCFDKYRYCSNKTVQVDRVQKCVRQRLYSLKTAHPDIKSLNKWGCPQEKKPSPPLVQDSDQDGVPDFQDQCPHTQPNIAVDNNGCPLDTDADGVFDFKDLCPRTPASVKVNELGCPFDSDKDGVPNFKDKCPQTPYGARVDRQGCWQPKLTLFDFNKSNIKPRYFSDLNHVALVIKSNPGLKIEIQGHADIIGTKEYNQKLSLRRAKAVRDYLVNKGVSEQRLEVKGFGYASPRAPSDTAKGRALNRRVEFKATSK